MDSGDLRAGALSYTAFSRAEKDADPFDAEHIVIGAIIYFYSISE